MNYEFPKHLGAALVINILTKLSARCWFFMYNAAMHGTNIKLFFKHFTVLHTLEAEAERRQILLLLVSWVTCRRRRASYILEKRLR
jgi:hypothetical protein